MDTMLDLTLLNSSTCANISLDLSEPSTRLTTHLPLQVAISLLFYLMALFIVGSHILVLAALFHHLRRGAKYANGFTCLGIARHKLVMLASVSSHHLILGAFCLPLAAYQVVRNGDWNLGPELCMVRNIAETLSEMVTVYHMIYLCIDTYILVCRPLKYRVLPEKFGIAMAAFCWATPITTSVIVFGLGWHTEGIEDILDCLRHRNICIALYSKKNLIFMVSTTILICIPVLITASVVVLKEINRFHHRKPFQNVSTICHIGAGEIAKDNLKESDLSGSVSRNLLEIDELPIAAESAISTSSEASQVSSNVTKNTNGVNQIKDNSKAVASTNNCSNKCSRKCKAIRTVVSVTVWHCLYWGFFLVFFSMLSYDTGRFPLWAVTMVPWLRYLNSALNTVIVYGHNSVKSLIRNFLKRSYNSIINYISVGTVFKRQGIAMQLKRL